MNEVAITIIDRQGVKHELQAPTDMNMNLMEVVRSYEIEPEGTVGICGGMAMCASCQCYIESSHELSPMSDEEGAMLSEASRVLRKAVRYELVSYTDCGIDLDFQIALCVFPFLQLHLFLRR
jgi:ferredoxin